jgi:hypothetical protein
VTLRGLQNLCATRAHRGASSSQDVASTARADTYSHEVVIADAVSLALIGGGYELAVHSDPNSEDFAGGYLLLFGFGGYLYTSAFIHHDHGHLGRGIGSGVLRASLPLAAGITAYELTGDRQTAVLAALGGAASAMLLDWTVLARPTTPYAAPTKDGAVVGIAGAW